MNYLYNIGKSILPAALRPSNAAAPDQVAQAVQQATCTVLPTLNCADTIEWRNELIKYAKHNIIVSGNYCGGKAFDDFLDLVRARMEEVPELKVIVIGHPKFVKNMPRAKSNPHQNLTKIKELNEAFPTRFCFIESPDIKFNGKTVTNHTKCTVIDYGKFYMQGGSAIKDNFALTGKDDQTTEQFLKRYWRENPPGHELIQEKEEEEHIENLEEAIGNDGFLDKIIPGNFRDQDFVFRCGDIGTKMYQEALYLAYKWDCHAKGSLPLEYWDLEELSDSSLFKEYPALAKNNWADLFKTFPELRKDYTPAKIDAQASQKSPYVLYSMLATPLPDLRQIETAEVPLFDRTERKVANVAVQLFFTGPEQIESPYLKQMMEAVARAEREIIIDQMYFQPPHELRVALERAVVERNVAITIITAGLTKDCPNGQLFFGHRNRWKYYKLINSLPDDKKSKVTVYEYAQVKKGLHKKVTIVDDTVFAGSSNMGTKSLKLMSDHEMNFQARSQELVDLIKREIIEDDVAHSQLVEDPHGIISTNNQMMAAVHRAGAYLWG